MTTREQVDAALAQRGRRDIHFNVLRQEVHKLRDALDALHVQRMHEQTDAECYAHHAQLQLEELRTTVTRIAALANEWDSEGSEPYTTCAAYLRAALKGTP